jgi:tetratricopeptide (TPR) repeat protein
VHFLLHAASPQIHRLGVLIGSGTDTAYASPVGNGEFLVALLPRGIESARSRFPRLDLRPLDDPQLARAIREEASRAYGERLGRHPRAVEGHLDLAGTLVSVGEPAAALPHYQAVYEIDRGRLDLWVGMGTCYQRLGDTERAITAFDNAYRIARETGEEEMMAALETKRAELEEAEKDP